MKKLLILLLSLITCRAEVEQVKCQVIEEITRSKKGFTQGFFIEKGKLYESTGGYGSSLVRRMDLKTQNIEISKSLPSNLFGEGLTPYGEDEMLQLTWKAGLGIVYDKTHINVKKTFKYPTEGWGITTKGKKIVMSDGSSTLYFLNPDSFTVDRKLSVTLKGKNLERLNELEWVGDAIYANVWMTDKIVKINPENGQVTAEIDCSHLYPERPRDKAAVLNGIAYDVESGLFYLTGKKWGKIYKVKFES